MKRVLLVVPTYNEADNIASLIEESRKATKPLHGYSLGILIVDDNSPDGTGRVVNKLQKNDKKLHLLSGKKAGLGKAYVRGLKHGLALGGYDIIMTMDADFSHDPHSIPSLVNAIEDGADYAIGSRYVRGGRTSGWPMHRKLNSRSANFIARVLLDLQYDIRDLTGGFKALRVSALKTINLDAIRASGYAIGINLLHEFSKQGYKISEVPITFSNRNQGRSKLRLRDVLEFLYISYRLNPDSRIRRIIRFSMVGASGAVVNLGTLFILVNYLELPVLLSGAIAIEVSIISNFFLNHTYTFRAAYTSPKTLRRDTLKALLTKLLKYNLIYIGGAAIAFTVFATAHQALGIHYLLADAISILVAMSWNYWMSIRIVWKVVDE